MLDNFLKMIKIIFISDIVGKIGRQAVAQYLPKLKKQYAPDLVIANAENLAHGIGFTGKTLEDVRSAGIDIFTSGNHAWKKAGSDEILNDPNWNIIRPANYKAKKSGVGFKEVTLTGKKKSDKKIGEIKLFVVNLLGRVFIEEKLESPFVVMESIIKDNPGALFLVDFHGEATSEKTAFANYFDGQITAVIGTHTHVQTSDERILGGGTAFITDAGMVGYHDSVIGANKEQIYNLFLETGKSSKKHDVPEAGECQFNGVYLEIDEKNGKAKKIKRLNKILKIKQ